MLIIYFYLILVINKIDNKKNITYLTFYLTYFEKFYINLKV
jgi:hypothetical protein